MPTTSAALGILPPDRRLVVVFAQPLLSSHLTDTLHVSSMVSIQDVGFVNASIVQYGRAKVMDILPKTSTQTGTLGYVYSRWRTANQATAEAESEVVRRRHYY